MNYLLKGKLLRSAGYYCLLLLTPQRLNLAEEVAGEIGIWVCFLQQTKLLFGFAQQAGVCIQETECEM